MLMSNLVNHARSFSSCIKQRSYTLAALTLRNSNQSTQNQENCLYAKNLNREFCTSSILSKWEGQHKNFYHADLSYITGKMDDMRAKRIRKSQMDGRPHMKGVVLRLLIRKPKKPNSSNKKCCKVRLSNGREIIAYIPGEGHTLQEHNVVLIEGRGRTGLPGVNHKVIRGALDCARVVKKVHEP